MLSGDTVLASSDKIGERSGKPVHSICLRVILQTGINEDSYIEEKQVLGPAHCCLGVLGWIL